MDHSTECLDRVAEAIVDHCITTYGSREGIARAVAAAESLDIRMIAVAASPYASPALDALVASLPPAEDDEPDGPGYDADTETGWEAQRDYAEAEQ